MIQRDSNIPLPIVLVTGALIVSLTWMLAMDRYASSPPVSLILLDVAASFVFLLSVYILPLLVLHGVRKRYLSVMDGWWWLTAPYSIACPIIILLLRLEINWHALAPFLLLYLVTMLASFAWMLVAIFNILSHRSHLDFEQAVRLGVVVLGGVLLVSLRAFAAG